MRIDRIRGSGWKRRLHLWHRWLGIGLCLFFCAWFLSGYVMMYVPFPALTPVERRAAAPDLAWPADALPPGVALAGLRAGDFAVRGAPAWREIFAIADPAAPVELDAVRLARIQGRPAYVAGFGGAQPVTVFADDGSRLGEVAPTAAVAAAAAFAPGTNPRNDGVVQSDQWTVSGGLNPHRPLHRVRLGDAADTVLYVSGTTGEVVRDTRRRERALNWIGAVVHWVYPHFLRRHPEAWKWTVNLLAAPATALAVTGIAVGLLRLRRRAPRAPRAGTQRWIHWHYLAGIAFGGVTFTFIFSGWLSMNPGGFNPPRTPAVRERAALAGGSLGAPGFGAPAAFPAATVEAELRRFDGAAFYLATTRDGARHIVPPADAPDFAAPEEARVRALACALRSDAPAPAIERLTGFDNHYYSRRPEHGTHPLPALRVRFADAEATWFHLDPFTGGILDRSTRTNRVYRHLYHGLHSLDWWWLWSRRPLWDFTVLTFNTGGLALSLLGVVLGVRRLGLGRRRAPRPKPPLS